jgi:hypothetical protein
MNLTWQDLTAVTGLNALLFCALQFLLGLWIKAKIENSIRYEYEFNLRKREQAVKVAKLLALWTADVPQDPQSAKELAWELSLWLPADIVKDLGRWQAEAEGAKDGRAILLDVRKVLNGGKDDGLKPEDIVNIGRRGSQQGGASSPTL